MHFDFTVTLGSILTILSIVGGVGAILHHYKPALKLLMEHDLMWADFLERNPTFRKAIGRRSNG